MEKKTETEFRKNELRLRSILLAQGANLDDMWCHRIRERGHEDKPDDSVSNLAFFGRFERWKFLDDTIGEDKIKTLKLVARRDAKALGVDLC